MKLEKLYWKSSYYWIRYLNYDYIYQNSEQHELWLCNRKNSLSLLLKIPLTHHKKLDLINQRLKKTSMILR